MTSSEKNSNQQTTLKLSIAFSALYLLAVGLGLWSEGLRVPLLAAFVGGLFGLAGMTAAVLGRPLEPESNTTLRCLLAGVGEGVFGVAVLTSALYWYRMDVVGAFVFVLLLSLAISEVASGIRAIGQQSSDV